MKISVNYTNDNGLTVFAETFERESTQAEALLWIMNLGSIDVPEDTEGAEFYAITEEGFEITLVAKLVSVPGTGAKTIAKSSFLKHRVDNAWGF